MIPVGAEGVSIWDEDRFVSVEVCRCGTHHPLRPGAWLRASLPDLPLFGICKPLQFHRSVWVCQVLKAKVTRNGKRILLSQREPSPLQHQLETRD